MGNVLQPTCFVMEYWSGNTLLHFHYFKHFSFQESHDINRYQITTVEGIFKDATAFNQYTLSWQTGQVIPLCKCITSRSILFEDLTILFVIRSPAFCRCSTRPEALEKELCSWGHNFNININY